MKKQVFFKKKFEGGNWESEGDYREIERKKENKWISTPSPYLA